MGAFFLAGAFPSFVTTRLVRVVMARQDGLPGQAGQ
jgi:hypothetical protein